MCHIRPAHGKASGPREKSFAGALSYSKRQRPIIHSLSTERTEAVRQVRRDAEKLQI
jgi:hypothetical protein